MTRAAPATATVGTRARGELRIAGLAGAATGRELTAAAARRRSRRSPADRHGLAARHHYPVNES